MKKVTIITPPEYDGLVLEALGQAGVTHLKEVTGPEFSELKARPEKEIDYSTLYQKLHSRYLELMGMIEKPVERRRPDLEELRVFAVSPESELQGLFNELDRLISQLKLKKEDQSRISNALLEELQSDLDELNEEYKGKREDLLREISGIEAERAQLREEYLALRARVESIQALTPEEFKRCFAVGVVKNEQIPQLERYLNRYEGTLHRTAPISDEESFLFVFGSDEGRKWVEALFLIFDIRDIFDVLDPRDVLLVLDPEKREEALRKYREQIKALEERSEPTARSPEEESLMKRIDELEEALRGAVEGLKEEYNEKIRRNEAEHEAEIEAFKGEQEDVIGKIAYYDRLLGIYADRRAPVLRSKVLSVIQGWTPESKVDELMEAVGGVEKQVGETLFVEVQDVDPEEDANAPTPPMDFKPSFLQPLWILTSLRGWPSSWEINPGYISVLVFSFQFGLMFGDVGQGAIFLIAGIILLRKFDRGMMQKLGGLFIPMGLSAIAFGFLYDSTFLVEGLFFHEHQIMPNPIEQTTSLMKLVFTIAALEVVMGLVLGAINNIRSGNPIGALGEHGLGMILYVLGLYLSANYFISIGLDFMPVLSHWTFYLMLVGMGMSFMEPVLHSVKHGHGVGMESIGEGVGGMLMTFVEGLANLFSFLRIAAFALAHASLAIAAEALTRSLGIAGIGLIIMNVVALSFEFVSSSVQSLRLLYYEFMGKFYSGEGRPFRPFRLNKEQRTIVGS